MVLKALTIGLPFLNLGLGYRNSLSFNLLATPGSVNVILNQAIKGPISIRAGYQWGVEGFQHVNRLVEEDQFFIERQLAFIGFQTPIFKGFLLRLNYGYRFNSQLYQAESIFDDDNIRFDLENSSYFEANLVLQL